MYLFFKSTFICSFYLWVTQPNGWPTGFLVEQSDSRAARVTIVFLDKTLYSHSGPLHLGVLMGLP